MACARTGHAGCGQVHGRRPLGLDGGATGPVQVLIGDLAFIGLAQAHANGLLQRPAFCIACRNLKVKVLAQKPGYLRRHVAHMLSTAQRRGLPGNKVAAADRRSAPLGRWSWPKSGGTTNVAVCAFAVHGVRIRERVGSSDPKALDGSVSIAAASGCVLLFWALSKWDSAPEKQASTSPAAPSFNAWGRRPRTLGQPMYNVCPPLPWKEFERNFRLHFDWICTC